ncbi:MAG: DUF1802 family protein [Microcoleaceae cyanobacterium]
MTQIQNDSPMTDDFNICHALKEWTVAVKALEEGDMILLLRKGGIKEQGGNFSVKYHRVLLYPTIEHQNPNLLKSEYAPPVKIVASGTHYDEIKISSWADITHILPLNFSQAERIIAPLESFHIWTQQWVRDRFNYKPKQPLYLLMLRTYILSESILIPNHSSYQGCRSWIDLKQSISLENSSAVLPEEQYNHRVNQIQSIINP